MERREDKKREGRVSKSDKEGDEKRHKDNESKEDCFKKKKTFTQST